MNTRRIFIIGFLLIVALSPFVNALIYRFSGYWADYGDCPDLETYREYVLCRQTIDVPSGASDVFMTFNILYSFANIVSPLAAIALVHVYLIDKKTEETSRYWFWIIVIFVLWIVVTNLLAIFLFGPPSGGMFTESNF